METREESKRSMAELNQVDSRGAGCYASRRDAAKQKASEEANKRGKNPTRNANISEKIRSSHLEDIKDELHNTNQRNEENYSPR